MVQRSQSEGRYRGEEKKGKRQRESDGKEKTEGRDIRETERKREGNS